METVLLLTRMKNELGLVFENQNDFFIGHNLNIKIYSLIFGLSIVLEQT